jgi:acetyltransferase-like isoleucine patch superfamily enzyme
VSLKVRDLAVSYKRALFKKLALRKNVLVGSDFHVGWGSIIWAPRRLKIGDDVYVGKGVTIQVDGEIGDQVLIANGVGIVGRRDHDAYEVGLPIRSSRWVGDSPQDLSDPIFIGSDVWIGYGAIILSGVKIGNSSIVAAGAVVTSDVPDNVIVAGVPATVRGQRFGQDDLVNHWKKLSDLGVRLLELGES